MLDRNVPTWTFALAKLSSGSPKKSRSWPSRGRAAVGRHAAVGGPAVVKIFVADVDARVRAGLEREGRVHAVALEVDMMAEAVAILEEPVNPEADVELKAWSKSPARRSPPELSLEVSASR